MDRFIVTRLSFSVLILAVSVLCEYFRWMEVEGGVQADVKERRYKSLPCRKGF